MSKNNSATVVSLTDSLGGTHEDAGSLQGKVLEQMSYKGNGGPLDSTTISSYWQSPSTATRVRSGLVDLNAHVVGLAENFTRQAVTSGGSTTWRQSETNTTFDTATSSPTYGLPVLSYSHSVPIEPRFDRCTITKYAKANTALNLVGLVASTETDSVACAGFTQGSPASDRGASGARCYRAPPCRRTRAPWSCERGAGRGLAPVTRPRWRSEQQRAALPAAANAAADPSITSRHRAGPGCRRPWRGSALLRAVQIVMLGWSRGLAVIAHGAHCRSARVDVVRRPRRIALPPACPGGSPGLDGVGGVRGGPGGDSGATRRTSL